ncbi:MAG: hypothetical protein QM493_11905 [Sulfurovum sp.]
MQTIQFKVDDNYLNIVLTLLNNLKINIVKELTIIDDKKSISKTDEEIKLDAVKGILKNRIDNPILVPIAPARDCSILIYSLILQFFFNKNKCYFFN